jgi:hypothetical protein
VVRSARLEREYVKGGREKGKKIRKNSARGTYLNEGRKECIFWKE